MGLFSARIQYKLANDVPPICLNNVSTEEENLCKFKVLIIEKLNILFNYTVIKSPWIMINCL